MEDGHCVCSWVQEWHSNINLSISRWPPTHSMQLCTWIESSPYISVALRVQPRFDPCLGISSDVEEFPLAWHWKGLHEVQEQLCEAALFILSITNKFWFTRAFVISELQGNILILIIPWLLFSLSSQVFGISQRSSLLSPTLAPQYVSLELHSVTTPHCSECWRYFRYFHLTLVVLSPLSVVE